jgi:hypothetical protein
MRRLMRIIDLNNDPINPQHYHSIGKIEGFPVNWRDDVTGKLPAAVMAFLEGNPSPEDVTLVIQYIKHHIHAPCWIETAPKDEYFPEHKAEIDKLRAKAMGMKTEADIREYINHSLDYGLDPL